MQAEAEFDGWRQRVLLIIMLQSGVVVEVIAEGGFEIEAKLGDKAVLCTC